MKSMFLRQSYIDNHSDYERSLKKNKFKKWDYVILTASNESQAMSYMQQINHRLENGFLPKETHYAVLPDPDGKRVGSGGATLNVMKYIREKEGCSDCFSGKHILVIHSGGDSRRVPQYSACGKLFAPVPYELPDGRRSTLFDEFFIGMSGIPSRIKDGMLVLSGDVLLLFNILQIDFTGNGAACISFKEPAETGKNHGVFLGGDNGYVKEFLHKQSVEKLNEKGAVDSGGNVNIDTGAIILSSEFLSDLFSLISTNGENDISKFDALVNEKVRLSFYADFLYPLAEEATLEKFYNETPEGNFTQELKTARELVWNAISKYKLKLISLSPAEFIHFGTTKELLSLMTDRVDDYRFLGWTKQVKSTVYDCHKCSANNSYIQPKAIIDESSYIEDSYIMNGTTIGKNCIISSSTLDNVSIPDNTVVHCLKLNDGRFVCRIYGTDDNPKAMLEDNATFLGICMEQFLKANKLSTSNLWDDNTEHSLWTAKLYAPKETIPQAVAFAINTLNLVNNQGDISEFLSCGRTSLCESFNNANVTEILPWISKLEDKSKAQKIIDDIASLVPVSSYKGTEINDRVSSLICQEAEQSSFDKKIRLYYYLSKLDKKNSDRFEDTAFKTIGDTIFEYSLSLINDRKDIKISKESVITKLPVRVNFGGGWSDTPPYCNEHGGTVLNAALKLNGELPIIAEIKKLDKKVIALESTDIGAYKEFDDASEIQACYNPYDPFAIHKAALISFGLISRTGNDNLSDILDRIGGGFYISTKVLGIPRGSGLGTSSILAGAVVKSLYDFFGLRQSDNEIFSTVMVMEQLMSTGGGWQDQVGGIAPGIKLIDSMPGMIQNIRCTHLNLTNEAKNELQNRFVLIYTGQRRLARNLLHEVVGNYLGARPESVEAFKEIQKLAVLMKFELERGKIDEFATLLNRHWECSKALDIGCTNTCIEQIFNSVQDMIAGRMICGAGGGGFLQCILKRGYTASDVREKLCSVFQDSGVNVWDCEFVYD